MSTSSLLVLLSGALAVQAASISLRAASVVSNANTSLTLIYQNNLNASDDKNHVGAIVVDGVAASNAAAACAALGETPLSKATLDQHSADFLPALSYYSSGSNETSFLYANGTVDVERQTLSYAGASSSSRRQLPVLCSQSANSNSPSSAPASGSQITVSTKDNTFVGYRNQKSFRFLGIPYADQPQRFQYSSVYSKTGQTIQAQAYGSQCAQGGSGSENCLFLNIQTPYLPKSGSTKNLRKVLFWIHGGGFTGGSGADSLSDGGNLASREDVVTVTINYRLSTLGFLAIPGTDIKGNYGIADQITALDWVVANIASFGGDPAQITIAGESAGAGSVRTLLGSPKAIGKFQGAIAMSNLGGGKTLGLNGDYGTTYSTYYTIAQSYAAAGQQIFTSAGCTNGTLDAQIACLSQVPALQVVGFSTVARYVVQDGTYVDTSNLIVSTRNDSTAHIPVIFGTTRNDGASFSTYPKTPISNHSQGLQAALGINAANAQRVIDSGLFPLRDTGNLTLDSFNVSQRIATDKTFRCVDQATVYAGAVSKAFERAYFYQMERTINGYDPNNVGGPANNNPNNPYFRLHGADMPWLFGTLGAPPRSADDVTSIQISTGLFGAYIRTTTPNPSTAYLTTRGYDSVRAALQQTGPWLDVAAGGVPETNVTATAIPVIAGGEAEGPGKEIRLMDVPGRQGGFVDPAQCAWLGYPLDYYLKGGA